MLLALYVPMKMCACLVKDRKSVVAPRKPDAASASRMVELSTVRVLEFSSETLRSGVVVLSSDAPQGSALLFLRGAPAVIKTLVEPASVPRDFDQVLYQQYVGYTSSKCGNQ